MTLSHRMNRIRDNHDSDDLAKKFYTYRGIAIRSLRQQLDAEDRCTGDLAIAGTLTLLLVDVSAIVIVHPKHLLNMGLQVQNGASPHWRWHLGGIHRMITLRGGFSALAGSESMESLLISFWL